MGGAQPVELHDAGQQPDRRCGRPGPGPRDPGDQVREAGAQAVDAVPAVDPRHPDEVVGPVRPDPAAGTVGHRGGQLAVDLGVDGVAEAQLGLGADDVAHPQAQVHPAVGGQHDVHAVGQGAGGHRDDRRLELLELPAQHTPAVDDEEDVAERVVTDGTATDRPGGTHPPIRRHGVDPELAEAPLPVLQDRGDLGDQPLHDLGLLAPGHPADVRQVPQREQRAGEVEAVELHLGGRVPQRERGHERPQRGRLARPWPPDDTDVATGPGEVDDERLPALLVGQVDGPDRDAQLGPVGAQAPAGALADAAEQHVEGLGRVERGQPHLVRAAAARGDPVDHHAQHGRPGGVVLGRRSRDGSRQVPRPGQDRRRERPHLARAGSSPSGASAASP